MNAVSFGILCRAFRQHGKRNKDPTFYRLVKSTLDGHVGHDKQLDLAGAVLLVKELLHPLSLFLCSGGAMELEASGEELVGNVGADEAIDAGDEDGRALFDWCHVVVVVDVWVLGGGCAWSIVVCLTAKERSRPGKQCCSVFQGSRG